MPYRLTLRARLVVACALLSTMVAVTLALIAHTVMELSEASLIEKTILREARMLARSFTQSPDFIPPRQQHFTLYVSGPGRQDVLPEELRGLGDAESGEVEINGVEYELIRVRVEPYTYYFLYDFSKFEVFEATVTIILLVSVLVCIALGVWIGLITSGQIIKPLRRLASSFEQQPDRDGIVDIPHDFTADEVGMLARKFAEYNERIRGYIEREKTFTSNASHELRTPLSVIAGAAEVLAESPALTTRDRETVARIRHETRGMAEVINLFLILSRDPGQLAAADEVIGVNAAVRARMEEIREACAAKGIALELIERTQLEIRGSRQAFDIVLRNLLNNSVQYTSRGRITVGVEQAGVTVEDTGPGISGDIRNRIFERFFRGEADKLPHHSGVGLALVKQLCTLCNWDIVLDTAGENSGTRFIFTFAR